MRWAFVRLAAVLGCLACTTRILGCDPSSAAAVIADSDGDGLSDTDERAVYGTSPVLADTDGDGITDHAEIVTNVFDPVGAPLRFNPRVADVPIMEIEIVSPPLISLRLVAASGETRTFTVSRLTQTGVTETVGATQTNGEGDSVSVSDTVSREFAVTRNVSITTSLTRDAGRASGDAGRDRDAAPSGAEQGPPVLVTISNGVTSGAGASSTVQRSRSSEVSLSFTEQDSRQLVEALTLAESYAQSHEIQASGAILEVLAVIRNRSNLAFQVTNLSLATSFVRADGIEMPVANLELSTALATYQAFALAPGQEIGPVNFFRDFLTLEQAAALFRDVRALKIRLGVYELSDSARKPYVFDIPTIRSRTATVSVDYGGLRPFEWYLVATNLDPARPGVPVKRAFQEILRMPFDCDPDAGHVSVRGIGDVGDGGANGRWCLFHRFQAGGEPQTIPYCAEVGSFDCTHIELRAGDDVRLSWIAQ
ncbi:MAG TPA: hypothetical protein VM925_15010 [Labilithrix sp.]|nr:hypothetical protein [Labilithrix sp.]